MARLREFDEVKALSAIEQVFWAQGFEGTSYADLTSASGLGKGSLYAAFGNKEALYVRSLLSYIEREIGLGVCLLSGNSEFEPLSGKERIHMFLGVAIDAVENRQDRRGCFVCNAAIDLAPFNPDVEEVVKSALARVIANCPKFGRFKREFGTPFGYLSWYACDGEGRSVS